jgi:hypothetical protein
VGGVYGTHGRGEKCVQGFGGKDQGVDGRMGSKWTLGRLVGGVKWIHVAQNSDHWLDLVNAVMNLQVLVPHG